MNQLIYQGMLLLQIVRFSEPACKAIYAVHHNMYANGAQHYPTRDLNTCKTFCQGNLQCTGFNWDGHGVAKPCWVHHSTKEFRHKRKANGLHLYILTERCRKVQEPHRKSSGVGQGSAKSSQNQKRCKGVYGIHTNRYAKGATYYPATTLRACKDYCTLDLHCKGFNWDANGSSKPCWIHKSTKSFSKKKNANKLYLYVLKDRCRPTDEMFAKSCKPEWQDVRNRYAKNAHHHPGANTADKCKADCAMEPNCFGVNVDLKPRTRQRCWFHSDPNNFKHWERANGLFLSILIHRCKRCVSIWSRRLNARMSRGMFGKDTKSEYQCRELCAADEDCFGVSIDQTVGLVPRCELIKDQTPFRKISPAKRGHIVDVLVTRCMACLPTWKRTQNERAKGGVRHLQVPTAMDCLRICVADPECVGVDFQTGSRGSCIAHSNGADLATTTPRSKYQHYVLLERCKRCLPVWTKWSGTRADGGLLYPAANTLEGCREACILDHSCWAVDFDYILPGTRKCFFHTNKNDLSKRRGQGKVDFYVLQDRCRHCTGVWVTHRNRRVDNAVYDPAPSTELECRFACLANEACLGVNIRPVFRKCELIYHVNARIGKHHKDKNFDFHQLRERCIRCTPVWQMVQKSRARGAVVKPDVASVKDCLDACAEDINCHAANIDPTPGAVQFCWLVHKRRSEIAFDASERQFAALLVQKCKHCTPQWLRRDHTIADGGYNYPTATTESQCKDACADDDHCLGVHYDIRPGSAALCWFHTDPSDFKKITRNGDFVLYELLTRCQRCTPVWEDIWHTHANGEMAYRAAVSREDCLRVCLYDEECIAIGYEGRSDASTVCFLHKDEAQFKQKQYNKKSTYSVHYLLERCKHCTPIWYVYFGRYLKKGGHHPGPVTEEDCAEVCARQGNCLGMNFDSKTNPEQACWLHYDRKQFSRQYQAAHINLYKLKERCARCMPVWSRKKGSFAAGGRLYSPAASERECKGVCADDRSCIGVYIDKRPGAKRLCWMLHDRQQLGMASKDHRYDMFILLERCRRCTARWIRRDGMRVDGAIHFVSDATGTECKQACAEDDRCKGVLIDTRTAVRRPCWLIRDDTSVAHPVRDGNYNLYLLAARCKRCSSKWEHLPNTCAFSGVHYQVARNARECKEACVEDMKCQAAAYDSKRDSTTRCWHYRSAKAHQHRASKGIHLFVLLERCSRCKSTWSTITDHRGRSGAYYPMAVSEKECKDACAADTECGAVSVDANPKTKKFCFLHTIRDDKTPVPAKRYTYFRMLNRCVDMRPLWEKKALKRAVGGYSYPATTVSQCKEACFEDDNCVGVDVDDRPEAEDRCWLHSNYKDVVDARDDHHFSLYVLQERCRRCTATWNQFPKMDFAGGRRLDSVVEYDCKSTCVSDERCAGIYRNDASSECYYTTSVSTFSHLTHSDSSRALLITHRCQRCTTFWEKFVNIHAMNGYRYIGPVGEKDCKDACGADDKCLGIDYSFADSGCYFHSNPKNFGNMATAKRIVHYRLKARCKACTPVWSRWLRMRADGGVEYSSAVTERDCKDACAQDENCFGVYYKTDPEKKQRCWFVNSRGRLNKKRPDNGYTLYILRERCRVFTPIWRKVVNRQPKGGHEYTAHTPGQCRKICVEDDGCVAVSMVPHSGGLSDCYLHENFAETADARPAQGSVIFKLVERCRYCTIVWKKYPGRHTDSHEFHREIKGEAECKSACAADDGCVGVDVSRQGLCFFHRRRSDFSQLTRSNDMDAFSMVERCRHCIPLWHKRVNRNAKYGYRYPGPATEEECKHACARNVTCKGVAFDHTETLNSPCWFFSKDQELKNSHTKKGTVLYTLEERCKQCNPAWIRKMNVRAAGGFIYPAATTENDCKIACAQDDGCLAVDVDTDPRTKALCWFHTSRRDFALTTVALGFRLYILSERCRRFTPIWHTKKNMQPAGGIFHPTAKTEKECKEACVADSSCIGVHADNNENAMHPCTFHTNRNDFANARSAVGVVSHAMVERCRRCRPVWHRMLEQRASGGYHREASSAEECKESCVADNTCLGVGVNVKAGQDVNCWFHIDGNDFTKISAIHGRALYVLVERCRRCSPIWYEMPKVRMRGGVHYPLAVSEKECQEACIDDRRCIGVNVNLHPDANELCWLHFDRKDMSGRTPAPNFIFLQLLDRCKLCAPVWQKTNDKFATSGVDYPAAVSESDCKEACADDYKCFGVDINLAPNATTLCHFHTEHQYLKNVKLSANTVTYKLVERCKPFSPVWEKTVNKRAVGGVYNPGVTSRRECKQACAVDDKCLGVDIDTTVGAKEICFFHNQSKDFLNFQNAPNFLQLKLLERTRSCKPIWRRYVHARVKTGGVLYPAADSEEVCKRVCATDNTCVGISVDTFPTAKEVCMIFSDRSKLAKRSRADGFMVYELLERCRRCKPLWHVKKNTRSQSGMLFPTATTEKDCKDACVSYSGCFGVDFNTDPAAKDICYFHTMRNNYIRTLPRPGFVLYQLAQRCRQCTPIWKKIIDKFVSGGVYYRPAVSEKDCRESCAADEACQGVHVDTRPGTTQLCWFHGSMKGQSAKYEKGVITYELIDRCRRCVPDWEKQRNRRAPGGVLYRAASLGYDCRKACAEDYSCLGVDINTKPGVRELCWFHTNKGDFSKTRSSAGFNLYILKDRCPVCATVWNTRKDEVSTAHVPYPLPATRRDCQAACLDDEDCKGVSMQINDLITKPCGLYMTKYAINTLRHKAGYTSYVLLNRCKREHPPNAPSVTHYPISVHSGTTASSTAASGISPVTAWRGRHQPGSNSVKYHGCSFKKMPNKMGPRSRLFLQTDNAEQCMKNCKDKSDCHGFSYHKDRFKYCYLYTRDFVDHLRNSSTNDVYIRGKC